MLHLLHVKFYLLPVQFDVVGTAGHIGEVGLESLCSMKYGCVMLLVTKHQICFAVQT